MKIFYIISNSAVHRSFMLKCIVVARIFAAWCTRVVVRAGSRKKKCRYEPVSLCLFPGVFLVMSLFVLLAIDVILH